MGALMSDVPGDAELHRLYQALREDTRRGFSDVNGRLDKMPTSEVLTAHLQAWQAQLTNMQDRLAKVETRQQSDADRHDRFHQWLVMGLLGTALPSLLMVAKLLGVIG